MTKRTLVGDIHGHADWLIDIINASPCKVVQIGDLGFRDTYNYLHRNAEAYAFNINLLEVIGGNHDEYPQLVQEKYYLGDFGVLPETEKTFFVRGAYSVDKEWRTPGKSWWPEEELTPEQGNICLELYEQVKPEVVLSHDCPDMIKVEMFLSENLGMFGNKIFPNYTGKLLNEMMRIHVPKRWYFGHWHKSRQKEIFGCTFTCLREAETLLVDLP